jgi:hypothetical protein
MIDTGKIGPSLLLATCLLAFSRPALGAARQAPLPVQNSGTAAAAQPAASEVVWVNTASGFYHKPSSRHYGKTKRGKYMQEPDAVRAGYRPAKN